MHFTSMDQADQLPAKLTRPRLQNVYSRKRLFKLLQIDSVSQAVWLCGPAGSGKTTAINSFLQFQNLPCLWYELDESDSDIASFFYHIGLAATEHLTKTEQALPQLTTDFLQSIPIFTRRFFEAFSQQLRHPFALVLDNYQTIKEESFLHEVLCIAIDSVGRNFSIFVCSRRRPPAEMARPQANCSLRLLGWKHLQLQKEEAREIAFKVTEIDIPIEVIDEIHSKTDGWVAGLLLILRRGEYEDIAPHLLSKHTPQEIFDYFGSVLFQRLEPEISEILIRLSYLPKISKKLAYKLCGSRSMDLLDEMYRRNAFTYRSLINEPVYFFHPLFKEFLQTQSAKQLDGQTINEIQVITAQALAEENQYDEALNLYLRSGHFQEAIEILLAQAPRLAMLGWFETLLKWINRFPPESIETTPWLLFWKGICEITFDPLKGQPLLRKALDDFRGKDDPTGCYLALSGMIDSILFQTNDFSELDPYIDMFYEFQEKYGLLNIPEIQIRITASMLNAISQRRPDSPDLPMWIEQGWQILNTTRDVNATLQAFIAIMNIRLMEGKLNEASNVLDMFAEVHPEKSSPISYMVYQAMRALHSWLSGNFSTGIQAAEEGLAVEQETGIKVAYIALRSHGAASALGLGNFDLARKLLDQITPFMVHGGYWLQTLYHLIYAWLMFLEGNIVEASFHAKSGLEKGEKCGHPLVLSGVHVMVALMHYELGEAAEAKKCLEQSLDDCQRYNTFQIEFLCLLTRARIGLDEGDPQAVEVLRKAFQLGRERNYRYTFFWQPDVMTRLCVEALDRGIEVDYVQSLVKEHGLTPARPPVNVANWPWHIRLFSFNGFKLERDGQIVTFTRKAQQRLITLLKCLLAKGGEGVSDLQLQYSLWPDSDGDAARNAYNTALHRLRKLLGDDRTLHHTNSRLSFNDHLVWTDIKAFQRCLEDIDHLIKEESQLMLPSIYRLLNKLLSIYQGPFLPEETSSWAIPMREKLQGRFLFCLENLAQVFLDAGDSDGALTCYRKGIETEPFQEALYEKQIHLLVSLGRATEARQLYDKSRATLETFGIPFSSRFELLTRELPKRS